MQALRRAAAILVTLFATSGCGDAGDPAPEEHGSESVAGTGGGDGDSPGAALDEPVEVRTITPPDAESARGGFADLPGFDLEDRDSRCVRPLLVGHRGSRFQAPENTIPAFVQAMEAGGDGVEIDVRPTADHQLVAFHDSHTQATTDDAEDRLVADLTLEELQALDAGSWFAAEWMGTRVPTVEAVIDALPDDALLVFDVKADAVAPLAELIEARGLGSRSVVASSSGDRLRALRTALPEVELLYFASGSADLSVAAEVQARYVRVPIDGQHLESEHWRIVDAGFEAVVSSTYLTWNVAMVFVNDMRNGVARREERMPAECE